MNEIRCPPDGWVAMLVLGKFTRGYLYIPDLGISLPYKAGDVVSFRSWALKHFISHFQGNRYVGSIFYFLWHFQMVGDTVVTVVLHIYQVVIIVYSSL
jgi:hypothetical protein